MSEIIQNFDDEYEKHIQDKHAKWDTPEAFLFSEVEAITHAKPISRTRIVKGENSEVYKIETKEGRDLIARISHSENSRFEQERWAIIQARLAGAPVPEILGIKQIRMENGLVTVSIQNEIPGVPMEEMSLLQEPESIELYKKLMKDAGSILAKIHSVKIIGFGVLDKNGKGQWTNSEDLWLEMEKWRGEIDEVAARANISAELITKALDLMKVAAVNCKIEQPVLIHDDFAPKHIMVADNHISGIIDFETCEGGDPVRDFARWQYHKKEFTIDNLLEGYDGLLPSDFEYRLRLWKVHMGLTTLEYYLEDGNQAAIHNTILKLEEDMNALE